MIELELIKRTDARYQAIRDRHYIPNFGTHGQQLHYLIHFHGSVAGIISGASAVYGCGSRDQFFDLPKEEKRKQAVLNQIVNNTVFRLEVRSKNLATQSLALWRRRIAEDWEFLYGVPVLGFETFVIEEKRGGDLDRRGTLYLADNWTWVGITQGNTKAHHKTAGGGGMNSAHTRRAVEKKLIFCLRRKKIKQIESYESSWQDKEKAKEQAKRRRELFERALSAKKRRRRSA